MATAVQKSLIAIDWLTKRMQQGITWGCDSRTFKFLHACYTDSGWRNVLAV